MLTTWLSTYEKINQWPEMGSIKGKFQESICDNFALVFSSINSREMDSVLKSVHMLQMTYRYWLKRMKKTDQWALGDFWKYSPTFPCPLSLSWKNDISKIKTIPSWSIVQIMKKMIGGTFTPTADKLAVFADLKKALKNNQLDYNWIINYNCQILGFGAGGQVK